jgi:hypothetical protein
MVLTSCHAPNQAASLPFIPRSANMTTNSFSKILSLAFTVLGINSSLIAQTKPLPTHGQSSSPEIVREVDFCEIVRRPQRFFNQTVRITATRQQGEEFSYLIDDRCPSRSSYEIAVQYAVKKDELTKANLAKLSEREYGGRAILTIVGVLRNPGKSYGYFRYMFEIDRLENVQHVITPYQGTMDAGKTYRAVVRGDKEFGLLLVPPLRNDFHYALRIEWRNLSEFPPLERLHETSGERTIVFSVMADERKQVDVQRWNRKLVLLIE